jgi:hypothetical protein
MDTQDTTEYLDVEVEELTASAAQNCWYSICTTA